MSYRILLNLDEQFALARNIMDRGRGLDIPKYIIQNKFVFIMDNHVYLKPPQPKIDTREVEEEMLKLIQEQQERSDQLYRKSFHS